jgi:SM-20-related protein
MSSKCKLEVAPMLSIVLVMATSRGAQAFAAIAQRLPATVVSALHPAGPGYAVVENFLSPAEVKLLKQDVQQLAESGRFNVAGVGDSSTNRVATDVRKAEQSFLFPKIKYEANGYPESRKMLYPLLDSLRDSLASGTGVALEPLLTEGAYMSYPNGGYYRRHIDSYANTPQALRKYSYLIYCNEDWTPAHGGCLRIHLDGGGELAPAGTPPQFVDVEPRAGTLVVFRSDVPHEVLETSAKRLAIAGWFNSPPEGSAERRSTIAKLGAALVLGSAIKFGILSGSGSGK